MSNADKDGKPNGRHPDPRPSAGTPTARTCRGPRWRRSCTASRSRGRRRHAVRQRDDGLRGAARECATDRQAQRDPLGRASRVTEASRWRRSTSAEGAPVRHPWLVRIQRRAGKRSTADAMRGRSTAFPTTRAGPARLPDRLRRPGALCLPAQVEEERPAAMGQPLHFPCGHRLRHGEEMRVMYRTVVEGERPSQWPPERVDRKTRPRGQGRRGKDLTWRSKHEDDRVSDAAPRAAAAFASSGIAALAGMPPRSLAQSRKETLVIGIDISDSTSSIRCATCTTRRR